MSKALLVVDMQEATVGENHAKMFDYSKDLLDKVNEAIVSTDAEVVVYIKNLMKNNLINKLAPVKCFEGTKEAELVNGLKIVSNHVYVKYEGNAFSNAKLEELNNGYKTGKYSPYEIRYIWEYYFEEKNKKNETCGG